MNLKSEKSPLFNWLFNPFLFLGGERLLIIGIAVLAIHIPVGYGLNVRFDGALDMHLVESVTSWFTPVVDILVAWGSMAICMFGIARLLRSPIRLIDIAGAAAVSRVPLLLSVFPAILLMPEAQSLEQLLALEGLEFYWLVAFGLLSLLFLIWYLALLFNAFKINSNLKGPKLWTAFIGSVIIAEILSLILLQMI